MASSVDHNKMRQDLMDGVVKAIATYGIEGMTTRSIANIASLNEAYIYRYFLDRDDLASKTFIRTDNNLFNVFFENVPLLKDESKESYDVNLKEFFNASWAYMTDDFIYCKFYIRYVFSQIYSEEAKEAHRKNIEKLEEMFIPRIKDDAKMDAILHHIYTSSLIFLMEIATGEMENTIENRDLLFELLYPSVMQLVDPNKIANFKK